MCGIFSLLDPHGRISAADLRAPLDALAHRGPEGEGLWIEADHRVALGHRRLGIIDLAGGAQPMQTQDGQLHLVVNGEFYGHTALRAHLEAQGHRFSSQSDSEIALHLYRQYGMDFLYHLRGEFALILYDARSRTLIAARDRFGIKPLCYAQGTDGRLALASEAKALFASALLPPAWDKDSIYHACTLQYTPPDRTVFAGIRQIPPGHVLVARHADIDITPYWDSAPSPQKDTRRSDDDWIGLFRTKLEESVALRTTADVPVCTHLSGGIDSSTVTALAARTTPYPLDSFIVRFAGDSSYDEFPVAQDMAAQAGVTLHSVDIDGDIIADTLADAVYASEGIAINSHLVGKYMLNRAIAQAGYKVALGGEGADELLAGYPHLREDMLDDTAGTASARAELYAGNTKLAGVFLAEGETLDTAAMTQRLGFTPSFLRAKASLGLRLHGLLDADYRNAMRDLDPFAAMADRHATAVQGLSRVDTASYLWNKSALANYILRTLGDGCEMPHAVEGRVPFLDHQLWELCRDMPLHLKIRDMREKFILREAARDLLTPTLYHRQKHPFIAPPARRLMTPRLRQMIHDTLASADVPFFDPVKTQQWLAHYDSAAPAAQVSAEPVLMTLLTTALLGARFKVAA